MAPMKRLRTEVPLSRGDSYRPTSVPARVRHHAHETDDGIRRGRLAVSAARMKSTVPNRPLGSLLG